ncbi:hypothetical protein PSEUDO8AS_50259 [Pseudomonas sp. 8AS]|nr:hypothetical protein PSEUDO8AS_50259 [Pseudomonas sp. 8AS]
MTGPPLRPGVLIYPFIAGTDIYLSDPMYRIRDVRAVWRGAPGARDASTPGCNACFHYG